MDRQYIKYIKMLKDPDMNELVRRNVTYFRTSILRTTVRELGECIGYSGQGVVNLENGHNPIRIGYLFSIHMVTGVPIEEFFKDHGIEEDNSTVDDRIKQWMKES